MLFLSTGNYDNYPLGRCLVVHLQKKYDGGDALGRCWCNASRPLFENGAPFHLRHKRDSKIIVNPEPRVRWVLVRSADAHPT